MSAQIPAGINLLVPSLSAASSSVLECVNLAPFEIVAEPGEAPSHIYFPAGCVVALLLPVADGVTSLAALVGNEGLVGVESFLGSGSRLNNALAMVQSGGPAWRLPAAQFELDLASNFMLQQRLMRYTLTLVSQMARTATCARQHSVEHQIARWLLQSFDRTPTQSIPLNPECLAQLLALDRDAALVALARIERSGGIAYQDAQIALCDRTAVESAACSCYGVMRDSELRALLSDVLNGNAPAHPQEIASSVIES